MQASSEKKKFERKVAPSKAPGRLLKKKLRDLERLLQNKDKLKDLPEEVVQETKNKIEETKRQIAGLGPSASSPAVSAVERKQNKKNEAKAVQKSSNGLKFTELRRAGRKISAYKKQHPKYEESEEESKAVADLELDLLYIKHFPKHEEYISIYPESPLTDSEQIKTQAQIREKIEKALASGEIKKSTGSESGSTSTPSAGEKHPVSNWSDDEDEDEEQEEEENTERSSKKMKTA
ncbi:hypothetical protein BGZ74_003875 [Mortierella antarctica]|nr:hypothetical protein BGZ74_003875 [Mortierella antarctica]KAG0361347.1 hypothetical protein BG005_008495 [Podila minutissima]